MIAEQDYIYAVVGIKGIDANNNPTKDYSESVVSVFKGSGSCFDLIRYCESDGKTLVFRKNTVLSGFESARVQAMALHDGVCHKDNRFNDPQVLGYHHLYFGLKRAWVKCEYRPKDEVIIVRGYCGYDTPFKNYFLNRKSPDYKWRNDPNVHPHAAIGDIISDCVKSISELYRGES